VLIMADARMPASSHLGLLLYRKSWYAVEDPDCREMRAVRYLESVLRDGRPLTQLDIDSVVSHLPIMPPEDPDCREMRAVHYLESVLKAGRPLTQLDIDSVVRHLRIQFTHPQKPGQSMLSNDIEHLLSVVECLLLQCERLLSIDDECPLSIDECPLYDLERLLREVVRLLSNIKENCLNN
jgi:hypothetical protein